MRRSVSNTLMLILSVLGISLIVFGAMSGGYGWSEYRYVPLYVLGGGFIVLLIMAPVSYRFAERDYKKVISTLVLLLSLGLLLLMLFFGFMGIIFSGRVVRISLAVMLPLYGLALLMAGGLHYLLSERDSRMFFYHMLRQLPYLYYRYRI